MGHSTRVAEEVTGGGKPLARLTFAFVLCLVAANCTVGPLSRTVDPKYGVAASPRVIDDGRPIPKGGGVYRVGNPYTIAGRLYVPGEDPNYRAEGIASWYGSDFHGRRTANGEIYDMHAISAAHPTLPIPSYVRVTNLSNQRSLIVRVNDRGPFKDNRIIDLSAKSAEVLGFRGKGLARVRVEYVGRASLDGSDDRKLLATLRHGHPAPSPSTMVASADTPEPSVRRITEVPTPAARPFEVGYSSSAPVAAGSVGSVGVDTQLALISAPQRRPAPEAAFIPASTGPSVVSGRGLY